MALDHYVPQVYLKQFNSPALGNAQMYAFSKKDLKIFPAHTRSVCRKEDGNTNKYLKEPRMVEDYLKKFEPKYPTVLQNIENKNINDEDIFTIAGLIACILACSPTKMRCQITPLEELVKEVIRLVERKGMIPELPSDLPGKSLFELIEKDVVKCEIDPKFSQALGIGSIESIINMLKNCKWEILLNRSYSSEFYTSDFPIAIEPIKGFLGINRIFPLSPSVAVRICITDESFHLFNDFSSPKFHYQIKELGYKDIVKINKLTIQCAEAYIFFRNKFQGIETFLTKNASYNLIDDTQILNTHNGKYIEVKTKINKKAP